MVVVIQQQLVNEVFQLTVYRASLISLDMSLSVHLCQPHQLCGSETGRLFDVSARVEVVLGPDHLERQKLDEALLVF